MRVIILDSEFNGLRPQQICQLSYIIAEDGQTTGRNFFFTVTNMNPYAQKKHGFSKYRLYTLSKGRSFVDRFTEFADDFRNVDLICGHNISADTRVLKDSFADAGYDWPNPKELCTMAHFDCATNMKNKLGKHKPPSLTELCEYFGLTDEEIEKYCLEVFGKSAYHAHDARFDAAATTLCILRAQERGDLQGVI